jgi:hypothetical protein
MDHRLTKLMIAVAALGLLTLSSCGKSTGSEVADLSSDSLQYQVLLAGGSACPAHTFSTFTDFCSGLQDGKLNACCGLTGREEIFRSRGCPGTFQISC